MRHFLFPVILLFITITDATSQTDFREGFIITLTNDTVKGQLDFRSNTRNSKSCLFRNEQGTVEYFPDQIIAFGFVNDRFFSSRVLENAFVEVLVSGDISLYRHKELFLIQKGSQLHELKAKKVVTDEYGQQKKVNDIVWKGIITYFISDCIQDASKTVSKLNLEEQSLTKLVARYNRCKGNPFIEHKASKPWTRLEAGLAIGAAYSNLRIDDQSGQFSFMNESYSSLDPEFGGVVALSSPRVAERIALQAEVYFRKSDYSGYLEKREGFNHYFDTYLGLTTFSLPLSVRYSFPGKLSGFYALAGITLDQQLQSSSKLIYEMDTGGVVYTFPEEEAFDIRRNSFGFQGGAGWLKSFHWFRGGISLKYIRLTKLNQTPGFSADPQRFSIHLLFMVK